MRHRPTTLKETLVAAVYVDQSDKNRRASSVIVSGLGSNSSKSDQTIFTEMCSIELGLQPVIVSTKRLGVAQTNNKGPRPLLVTLRCRDDTQQLLASARLLRQSSDPVIRAQVYINANLTKAEAAAAYQLRQRRRLMAVKRGESSQLHQPQPQQSTQQSAQSSSQPVSQSSSLIAANESGCGSIETACTLSASASCFVPVTDGSNLKS